MACRGPDIRQVCLLAWIVATAGCGGPAVKNDRWPDVWLAAGDHFGRLVADVRLTNQCELDPHAVIVESPGIEVTPAEILGAVSMQIRITEQNDVPEEVLVTVNQQVFGQEMAPDRVIEKREYNAYMAAIESLGPWPRQRTIVFGPTIFSCYLSVDGSLRRAERRSLTGHAGAVDIDSLNSEGPFRFIWDGDE